MRASLSACLLSVLLVACGDDTATNGDGGGTTSGGSTSSDGTTTGVGSTSTSAGSGESSTSAADSSGSDGSSSSGAADTSGSTGGSESSGGTGSSSTGTAACADEGARVYQGDGCNFCTCEGGELVDCSDRECEPISDGCTYDGTTYAYAERFDSTDECNECVCAASGLACTRREDCENGNEEGAILLEDDLTLCGDVKDFNGALVRDGLEPLSRTGPLDYDETSPLYPDDFPTTDMTLTIAFPEDGYVVCRIPSAGQEALDLEAVIEWQTDDGRFDEGQHTYVRRNARGFLLATTSVMSFSPEGIHGSYSPDCPDAGSIGLGPRWNFDGTAESTINKTCEVDIGLSVGNWTSP